ncbi:MAG TPA: hypothetical protein VK666_19020, partial [Chryseolinea sp.]|nr:hypothetical protein [Chryseolinea sp.]
MEFSEANIFVLCRVNEVIPKAPGRTSNYREVKSFLIDPNDADGFRAVVKYVFLDNPSGLFAITIDASNEESLLLPSTGWDDIFCSILAHPSYVRINEQPVVSVKGKGNAGAFGQRLIDHMEGQAMRQGYSDLLFAFVPSVIEEFDATNGFVYM